MAPRAVTGLTPGNRTTARGRLTDARRHDDDDNDNDNDNEA
jgi:hypothetical protein